MNAAQRRNKARACLRDHFRWPLGTLVKVLPGHHSPAAVGLTGRVNKHGYPCTDGVNCLVAFPEPVMDLTFSRADPTARFCHYVEYRHLRKVKGGAQ